MPANGVSGMNRLPRVHAGAGRWQIGNVDDNPDLDMTNEDFDDRMARGEPVTVVAKVGGGVAGGDTALNSYLATNSGPRIARADNSGTQALLRQ